MPVREARTRAATRALLIAATLAGVGLVAALVVGLGHLDHAVDLAMMDPDSAAAHAVARRAVVLAAVGIGLMAVSLAAVVVLAGIARSAERERRRLADELGRMTRAAAHAERVSTLGLRTAGIVHDLRSPLGAVLMGCELLHEPEALTPELQARIVGNVERAAERTLDQVNRLLDFTRTEADGGAADPVEAARMASRLVPIDDRRRVDITLEPTGRPVALGEQALVQVLMNLICNGLQAGEAVRVTARWTADGPEICVDDDGPGVPAALRDRIFSPFFTTKRAGEGTGLGLPLCRATLEEAGGALAVEDGPLGGARFVVTVPWAPADRLALAG